MGNRSGTPGRLFYLDWLRVLAMIGIFLFHNARFYDAFSDWHVKNASINLGASMVVAFLGQWIMPLFFLIAGAGTYFALRFRNAEKFVLERSLRLLVPLAFGMLVIVVPQAYFEAVGQGYPLGGYNLLQVYGLYLGTLPDSNWFHLWFLAYLFVFSLITLPILAGRGGAGNSIISRLARFFDKPWALLALLVLSIGAVNALIYPAGFWGDRNSAGGWNIVTYVLFFIFGYLIFANGRIMETVKKLRWVTLAIAAAALTGLLAFLTELIDLTAYFGTPKFILSQFIQALSSSCWLLAILGLASRYLNKNNRFLSYANEAVLPFYILHQTVIIVIGFFVVQWSAGVGLKYLIISTTSFVAIMLIYEFLVRRANVVRFLFGMKTRKRPVAELERASQT